MRREKVPKYWLTMYFTELEDLVKIKRPNEYERFRYYNMDLNSKFRYIELINSRYEDDKKNWNQILERFNKFRKKLELLSQDEFQKESQELGEKTILYSNSIVLDIDSFFIFSKILLDRIPYLLIPLTKGIVANQDIAERDLKEFVKWFKRAKEKNPEYILDNTFCNELISFYNWFENNLKDIRDHIIVHPDWRTIQSIIGYDAKLERTVYKLRMDLDEEIWEELDSLEMPDINVILEKIIMFLEFLNKYFCEKLSG